MDTNVNDWKEKRRAKESRASLLRRLRTPVLCVASIGAVTFLGIPLLFNVIGLTPTVVEIPEATPLPETPLEPVAALSAPAGEMQAGDSEVRSQDAGSQYRTLREGDTDPMVMDIQIRLMELEYLDGDQPTELFGEQTAEAIKRFQRIHNMTETGVADELTQSILFSQEAATYHLEAGDSGNDVKRLQNQLYDLGYYGENGEKRNGYFGTATQEALIAFQTKNKLATTGIEDQQTRDVLYSSDALPKVDPTPTPSPTPKPTKTPKPEATKAPVKTEKPQEDEPVTEPGEIPPELWIPQETEAPVSTPDSGGSSGGNWSGSGGSSGNIPVTGSGVEAVIATAESRLGCPYVYADEGPNSFDCSGLVYYCLRAAGVQVSRMSSKNLARVDSWQTIPDQGSLIRGDLVFFTNSVGASDIGHVGIYMGSGKYIHASSSAGKVIISSWSDWASQNFQWAKRVF